jgi:AAA domain
MAEKNYLTVAKARVHRPAEIESFRSLLVYGRNKKGKTRFSLSAGIERTICLDPEHGTDTMKELNPWVWPITSWADMQEAYGALRTGKLSPNFFKQGESSTPFDWLSVDGVTKMNNMALRFVMKTQEERDLDRQPGFVQQRDYGKSGELMKQMLTNFHGLKMNVVYTAQERMRENTPFGDSQEDDEEPSAYLMVPDLPAGVKSSINSVVEVIGRLYTTVIVPTKGVNAGKDVTQRRLWIGIHDRYDTGYRSDFILPNLIKNPTIPKLVSAMIEGGA